MNVIEKKKCALSKESFCIKNKNGGNQFWSLSFCVAYIICIHNYREVEQAIGQIAVPTQCVAFGLVWFTIAIFLINNYGGPYSEYRILLPVTIVAAAICKCSWKLHIEMNELTKKDLRRWKQEEKNRNHIQNNPKIDSMYQH